MKSIVKPIEDVLSLINAMLPDLVARLLLLNNPPGHRPDGSSLELLEN